MATQSDGGIIEFDDYEEPVETEQETFADRIRAIVAASEVYRPETLIGYVKWLIMKSAHNGIRQYELCMEHGFRLWHNGHCITDAEMQQCVECLRNEGFNVEGNERSYIVRW